MIRWITKQLGTAAYDSTKDEEGVVIVDVRDLVDKAGNSTDSIASKIELVMAKIKEGGRVVICCDYGMSRSNSVAAGVIAKLKGISFADACREVISATGEKNVKIEVLNIVQEALTGSTPKVETDREKNILITGAGGFIGSALVPLLEMQGINVIRSGSGELNLLHDIVFLDLLLKEHNVGTLVHLANPRIYSANDAMGTSVHMMKNVLDACLENDVKIVYLSSWEVYSGYKTVEMVADESLAFCPGGTYGLTKVLCEELINHFRSRHNLRGLIIRSSPVYGAESDRPKFIWNFLEKAYRGIEIVTHRYINSLPALDLLHISDLCKAVRNALQSSALVGDINVGSGKITTTLEIAEYIVAATGSPVKVKQSEIQSHAGNIMMCAEKAGKLLHWAPEITLEKGLDMIIKKYMSAEQ